MSLEEKISRSPTRGTKKDDTVGMEYSSNMWGEVAIGASALLAGVALYRSGGAKKAISKFIKTASSSRFTRAGASARAFRNWMNSADDSILGKTLSSKILTGNNFKKLSSKKGRAEIMSDIKDNMKNLVSDETFSNANNMINNLDEEIAKQSKKLESLKDTSLLRQLQEIKNVKAKLKKDGMYANNPKMAEAIEKQMLTDWVKANTLSAKEASKSLKRTGHREVTLGDIFVIKKDKKGNNRLWYKDKGADVANKIGSKEDLNFLKTTLEKTVINTKSSRKSKLLDQKGILNLKLDNAILTDGHEISDLRYFRNSFHDVANSLAKDFKIPVIGINPFSILGLHEVGKYKTNFAILGKGTIQSGITGNTKGINKNLFFSNGNVFDVDVDGKMNRIKGNMELEKIYKDATIASRALDATRKMNGTNRIEYNEYTEEDGFISNLFGRIGKTLDLGFDDIDMNTIDEMGATDLLNPNTWITKVVGKFKKTGFLRPNKGAKLQEVTDEITNQGRIEKNYTEMFLDPDLKNDEEVENLFVAVNKAYSIMDIIKDADFSNKRGLSDRASDGIVKYIKQFTAGRDNLDEVTKATTTAHYLFDRVSSTLGVGGFGFSTESLDSPIGILKNLLLKRVAPLYLGYNAVQFGIMLTEHDEDELGNKDHFVKDVARTVAKTDLVMRKGLDIFGLPTFLKSLGEAMPGIDHLTELPVINSLKLDQTYEEREEYYQTGVVAVRKNRYWDGGSQAFTGSKIDRFAPNMYRRIMADAEFSDTKHGSRWEYFSNAPFPTPLTPFAPIKHFITDPYHYDKKHSEDRPYPVTTPMFQNIPFVGSILSSTIGEVIKPTKYTHPHIFNDKGFEGNDDAPLTSIPTGNTLVIDGESFAGGDSGYMAGGGLSAIPTVNIGSGGSVSLIGASDGTGVMYEGISGGGSINDYTVNGGITYGSVEGLSAIEYSGTQNDIIYNTSQLYEDAGNFFGLYGFMGTTITGEPLDTASYVENGSYAFSHSRSWWNMEAGGLGGDVNEIARRFMRKRMHDDNLINPIRNNMADWLPGSDYYKDFKSGDPFVKISSGELRLPGQAYERLHGIDDFELYNTDAGFLYSKESAFRATIDKTGGTAFDDRLVNQALKLVRKSGKIVDSAGTIEDYDRNISADYDAVVKYGDNEGMLFVTPVDNINNVTAENRAYANTKANVSMYLAGQGTAYNVFVDRKTGGMSAIQEIQYDKGVVDNAMDNMVSARDNIQSKMNNGQMSNSDLYSPLEKLRVLADVAPYSNEYRQMKSVVANSNLSEDEMEEARAINDRVKKVKEPLRLYDYKFRHRGTTTDKKVVASILSESSFTVYGDNRVYRLAGIKLKKLDDQMMEDEKKAVLEKHLKVGEVITVEFDKNPALRGATSNKVIVKGGSGIGKSLQQELLDKQLAEKNTSDDPIDIEVKTNVFQKALGATWETFAHMDSPFHSKFLRVRSAKEDYERSRVYGKQFSSWSNPIDDYLIPLVFDRNVGRSMVGGLVMATSVGAMFGKTKYGKAIGATLGFGTVAIGKMATTGYEMLKGETWRPKRVREEQELYDYMDKLKYVKYRKLYHEYADKASKEGVNVEGLIGASFSMKGKNNRKKRWLQDHKVLSDKLTAIGVPQFLTRLMPRSDLNISGLIKDEIPSFFLRLRKRNQATIKELEKHFSSAGKRIDESSAEKKKKTLGERLDPILSKDVRDKEAEKVQKNFFNSKMSRIRNSRLIMPLRGNFRYDREAPDNDRLSALVNAKVALQVANRDGATDDALKAKVKATGVIPIYKGMAFNGRHLDVERTIMRLNKEIGLVAKKSGYSENAAKALEYYKLSESTMHAFDKGDSVQDVAFAMEKKDRDYFEAFLTAPDEEKLEILDLVPKYMRRPLEASWGLEVEGKDNLVNYFAEHALPDEHWSGWDENIDLNSVKVKIAKSEELEFSDVNVWASDVREANAVGELPIPKIHDKTSPMSSRLHLQTLMGSIGYSDVMHSYRDGLSDNVNLYLQFSKKALYSDEIEGKLGSNI